MQNNSDTYLIKVDCKPLVTELKEFTVVSKTQRFMLAMMNEFEIMKYARSVNMHIETITQSVIPYDDVLRNQQARYARSETERMKIKPIVDRLQMRLLTYSEVFYKKD